MKNTTGIMNNVAPAPTAGQSRPPSPMIVGESWNRFMIAKQYRDNTRYVNRTSPIKQLRDTQEALERLLTWLQSAK